MGQTSQGFGISLKLQENICLLGQSNVFDAGEYLLDQLLGINISAKQIQRVSERYGQLIENKEVESIKQEEGLTMKKEAALTYVMLDGSMLFTREEGWKEIKVGRVFQADKIINLQTKRNQIMESLYVCHLGEHSDFLDKIENHIERYTNKVCVADGAKWIWNWATDRYPNMVQILDLYHALEKLGAFASAQYRNQQERVVWVEQQKQLLLTDDVEQVIQNVKVLEAITSDAQKTKDALISYFTNNQSRMMYGTYKAKGYTVGSGAIESAHRNVIQQRLKLSGQRWSKKGAQQIANLRAYQKSNCWDSVVELIKNAA